MRGAKQVSVTVISNPSFDYSYLFNASPISATQAVTIGVLSDTHIPFRLHNMPGKVSESFSDCQIILHAGDLEDPAVLAPLRAIAPTHAVAGNIHWTYASGTHDLDMPKHLSVILGPHKIWMTHGHWNFGHTFVDKVGVATRSGARRLGLRVRKRTPNMVNESIVERIGAFKPHDANIVIFGHSHARMAETLMGALFFNPGAVVGAERGLIPPSIGKLRLYADGRVQHEWIDLS